MARKLSIFLIIVVLLLAGCSGSVTAQSTVGGVVKTGTAQAGATYTELSAVELQQMLANKDFLLVNVHTPFEGKIAGTDLSIPYDQLTENLDKLPDKDAKIVLYCRSGHMSAIAAQTLVSLGYTNILDLSGGMLGWEQAGFNIEH